MLNTIRLVILPLSGAALILYLSLKSSPHTSELSWLPDWLSHWADQDRNGEQRTAVPFFVLSCYLSIEGIIRFQKCSTMPWLFWILCAYGLVLILVGTEVAQHWLPQRTASIADVFWGLAGTALGGFPLVIRFLLSDIRQTQMNT